MSAGRRSWRPEKKRKGRDDRRIKIVALSSLLVLLAAFLLLPILSDPEPPVRFVSLGTDPSAAEPSGLIAATDSVSLVSRLQLDSLFRKLHALNPGQVKEPATVTTLSELKNAVKPKEKLVLYCSVPARAELDQDAADPASASTIVLHPGPVGEKIPLKKLLDVLKEAGANQIVLLMDFTDQTPGLANGILNDDVVELLHASVHEASIPGLSLICSSTAGQRSWELLAETTSSNDSAAGSAAADGAPAKAANAMFGVFSGTVFAHFVGEAFVCGETTTTRQLGEYLQTNVADWVQDHYGETQTVTLLGKNVQSDESVELLRNGGWSIEDVADTRDPNDPEPIASNSGEATDQTDTTSPQAAADTAQTVVGTPDAEFVKLLEATRALDPNCRAIDPSDWMTLNALLVATRNAMLQGDQRTCGILHDRARSRLQSIAGSLKTSAARDTENNFSPWVNVPQKPEADPTARNAILQSAALYVQECVAAAPDEKLKQLPRDLWGQPFADAFVNDLRELAETVSGNPTSQAALIAPRVRLIQFLGEARPGSWPKKDWPQELLTIDELLATDGADPDRQPLPQLVDLIELRQQTLTIAAGFRHDGSRIRAHAWNAESAKLQRLLIQLTAVERWLSMGSVGFSMAEQTLTDARSHFGELNDLLQEQQKRSIIQDAQQTDLAFLIQYLAQQHEQVPLTSRELDAALQLVDSENPRVLFPDGLLKPLDMDAMHIDAMFALTRNLEQNPVTDTDLRDHDRLRTYVARRVSGSAVAVEERHRLLNLPGFETASAELIKGLRESGPKAATGDNHTGIWLAFWSIRLLDAVSHQTHPELWSTWKQLVQHVKSPAPQSTLVRIQLAEQLRSQWAEFRTSLKTQSSTSVFASRAQSARLISQDLTQRHQASARNAAHYARIHQTLLNETLPARNVAFTVAKPELKVDQENRASIDVTSTGGTAIYVSRSRFVLEQVQTDLKKGWQKLDNDRPQRNLVFRANNVLTDTTSLTLALVNPADVVLATQTVIIHPGTETTWDLEFLLDDQPLTLLDGKELQLPPTTLGRKDDILPLTVRLTQYNGAVKQVQVQAYTFPNGVETQLWDSPQTLELTNQQVVIPMRPATTDTAAPAAANTPASTIDLQNGIRFEVQPLGFETKSTPIAIEPVLFAPSQYVRPPQAKYDAASRTLTITVQPENRPGDLLWPEVIPLEIHFSPALERLRQGEAASKTPSLPNDGQTFQFQFREAIEQAFRNDSDFLDNESNLEFGLSVAGVPYAWQWRLQDNSAELLLKDDPIVRATLTLNPDNKAQPVQSDKLGFLFARPSKADAEPTFDVQMHIFRSGIFQRSDPEWELQLRVQNTATGQSARILDPPIQLTGRHQQSITAAAGPKGIWNFSTRTEAFQRRNLQIDSQLGLGAGRYELIAGVKRIGRTDDQPQEHHLPFVIDATPPDVSIDVRTASLHSTRQPLIGFIKAEDDESEVSKYIVTLDGGEPLPVKNGKFSIPVTQLPQMQPGPGETKKTDGTITAVVVNGAGLESAPVKQRIVFFDTGPPKKAMAPAPVPPGVVVFESEIKEPQIRLWKKNGTEVIARGGGAKKIELKEIPPGEYKLTWTGPPAGLKNVTVKSGETTTVSP